LFGRLKYTKFIMFLKDLNIFDFFLQFFFLELFLSGVCWKDGKNARRVTSSWNNYVVDNCVVCFRQGLSVVF
jgi:hypothetical protein